MVVRMRSTKSHTANRRSHHALKSTQLVACANCKALKRSHAVCVSCGHYRGRKVLDLIKKTEKKSRRKVADARSEGSAQKKAKAKVAAGK